MFCSPSLASLTPKNYPPLFTKLIILLLKYENYIYEEYMAFVV